jgi:20S proteasome subunit beta 3
MTGKECVAIACDLRFGVQNQTNATDMTKVFKIHDQLYCGLAGLATDMMTLCVRASAPRRRVAVPRRRTDKRETLSDGTPAGTRASSSDTTCTSCARTAT